MKGKLEYDLTDHEERQSHLRAVKSLDLACVIWDVQQMFRNKLKGDLSEHDYELVEKLQENFYDILEEHNIDLDELLN